MFFCGKELSATTRRWLSHTSNRPSIINFLRGRANHFSFFINYILFFQFKFHCTFSPILPHLTNTQL